jgi:4-oxalocrotonate tautomerase
MPMITVQVATGKPSRELARTIADTISNLTARALGKDPSVTAVAVEFLDAEQWYIAGESTTAIGKAAFFIDTRITDGTNTKDEKAAYIAQAFAAMDRLLNGVHQESYVHVHDVRGDAYGYGGLTQERRFIAARP